MPAIVSFSHLDIRLIWFFDYMADPAKSTLNAPLKYGGSLDKYGHFDVTPAIGREYSDLQLSELLKASNSESLLRDLATISEHSS